MTPSILQHSHLATLCCRYFLTWSRCHDVTLLRCYHEHSLLRRLGPSLRPLVGGLRSVARLLCPLGSPLRSEARYSQQVNASQISRPVQLFQSNMPSLRYASSRDSTSALQRDVVPLATASTPWRRDVVPRACLNFVMGGGVLGLVLVGGRSTTPRLSPPKEMSSAFILTSSHPHIVTTKQTLIIFSSHPHNKTNPNHFIVTS